MAQQKLAATESTMPSVAGAEEQAYSGPNTSGGAASSAAAHDALPDLSRLSMVDGIGGQDAVAPSSSHTTTAVHISVQGHGTPVTINVLYGTHAETASRMMRVAGAPHALPVASPARIRLPPTGPVGAGAAAAGGIGAPPPLSPLLQGLASPRLESVPNTPAAPTVNPPATGNTAVAATVSPAIAPVAPGPGHAALIAVTDYEYIAPRDDRHRRWYVVTAGHRVGIWREWVDMAHYVLGVPGNSHKGFDTRAEAEAHYYANKAGGQVEVIMP